MIEIKHLSKTFQMKDGAVNALSDINLTIPDGSIYGIIGMSGAGKSTLVRCINLLERPTEGSVVIDGVEMEKLSPAELRARRREITMIFQQFNLLMQRSCLKNICFPMELAGVKKDEAEKRARALPRLVRRRALPHALGGKGRRGKVALMQAEFHHLTNARAPFRHARLRIRRSDAASSSAPSTLAPCAISHAVGG